MSTPKKIELIARALILNEGKVLLCRSVEGGHCYLPGGHVEPGETSHQAVVREMNEEAGVGVRVGDLVVVHEHCFEQGGRKRHELNLVFHVELDAGISAVESREAEIAFEWVPLELLSTCRFVPAGFCEAVVSFAGRFPSLERNEGPLTPTAAHVIAGW